MTPVNINPGNRDLFSDTSIFLKLPHSCPFFRHQPGSKKACCTVRPGRKSVVTTGAGDCSSSIIGEEGSEGSGISVHSARRMHT